MPRTNLSDTFTPEQRASFKPRIIARNTFRYSDGGAEVIRLHFTDIMRRESDGSIVLSSGGWKTMTTKDRLNNALVGTPYSVQSDRGIWKVYERSTGRVASFVDGMRLPDALEQPDAKALKVIAELGLASH